MGRRMKIRWHCRDCDYTGRIEITKKDSFMSLVELVQNDHRRCSSPCSNRNLMIETTIEVVGQWTFETT